MVLLRESMQEYSNFGSRKAMFGMLHKLLLLAFISFSILHCPRRDSSNVSTFQFSSTFLSVVQFSYLSFANRSGMSPYSDLFAAWTHFRSTFPIIPCASMGSACPSQLRRPSSTFSSIFQLEGILRRRNRHSVRRTHQCASHARVISSLLQ